jgi:transposase
MASTKDGQLVDVAGPIFVRQEVGQDVVLLCRGLLVASFRQGDAIGRDVAIATLVRVGHGLKTDTIAELCGASHGWVCHVRQRLTEGGLDRVVERARRGPGRKLVGAKEERLREMHAGGSSVRQIATALGVSKSLVSSESKRLKLPPSGWRMKQRALPISTAVVSTAAREIVGGAGNQTDGKQTVEKTSDDSPTASRPSRRRAMRLPRRIRRRRPRSS